VELAWLIEREVRVANTSVMVFGDGIERPEQRIELRSLANGTRKFHQYRFTGDASTCERRIHSAAEETVVGDLWLKASFIPKSSAGNNTKHKHRSFIQR
jgi:hypothetical protein